MKPHPVSTLSIVRLRRQRREIRLNGSRQRTQGFILGFGIFIGIAISVFFLGLAVTYVSTTRGLPPVEELSEQLDRTSGTFLQPTQLYDRTGQHKLATISPSNGKRNFIAYNQFPKSFIDATLALAQPDFWNSPGFEIIGWQYGDTHPTLAQRLVHDFLLLGETASAKHAIRERLLAAQVTARFGREQVVEWVLNSTDYGHYAFGAESAAQLYFGKSVTGLSLSEAALLAAIGNAPALNPFDAPQAAEAGRIVTIQKLLALGWINPSEANIALAARPRIQAGWEGITYSGISEQFVDLLVHQLDATLGIGFVKRGGVIVHTSLDYDLQIQADCSLQTQLARISRNPEPIITMDGSPCVAGELLPEDTVDEMIGEAIAGAVIIDPASGQILAAAGNLHSQPAGTAVTPFIYLAGFASGLSPASLGWDVPINGAVPEQVYHGPVRLRNALANDYLPPAQTILSQMGMPSILSTGISFGLDFPNTNLLLTDFSISPFDLAFSYATLATLGVQNGQSLLIDGTTSDLPSAFARGNHLVPAAVFEVHSLDGSTLLDWSVPQKRLVVSQQLSYLLNHILSDENARSPSPGQPDLLNIGRPVAVKVSRTLSATGHWVTGYTPQRVIEVYMSVPADDSGILAQELWNALAQYSARDFPATGWEMPPGIVKLTVCDPSGLLPTQACQKLAGEVFLEDRQPVQADNLYQSFQINIETGLLATVFTPPSLVREQVYMVVPAEASSWSEMAGIIPPPSTYDMYRAPEVVEGVQITAPTMFSIQKGKIEVRGSATAAEFVSYRIDYGEGLNPKQWIMLGEEKFSTVVDGLLASWDTSGLNGLYTLRLLVLQPEKRLEQAFVQLTLDNNPPEIYIQYPQEGETIRQSKQPQTVLQAQVDDAFLGEVSFYLDGEKIGDLPVPPFGVIWDAAVGNHVLRVSATDLAGNISDAQVQFTVIK